MSEHLTDYHIQRIKLWLDDAIAEQSSLWAIEAAQWTLKYIRDLEAENARLRADRAQSVINGGGTS